MHRLSLALVLTAALAAPAAADTAPSMLPAVPGSPVAYRLVRTQQTAHGPANSAATFDIVRRSPKTLVLTRTNADGTPNLSVLTQAPDGTIALSEDARGAAADADLADVLYGINLAITATAGADPAAKNPWNATIPLTAAAGAPTVPVTVVPAPVAAGDFDFSGQGDGFANPAPRRPPADDAAGGGVLRGGGGFPGGAGGAGNGGGFPGASAGGGFPGGAAGGFSGGGGGYPRRERSGGATAGGTLPVSVRVDGHVSAGRVTRVTVTQTRSVTIGGLPYVNVGSWSLSAGR